MAGIGAARKSAGGRPLNVNEKRVLAVLKRCGKPASAYEIIGDLKPQGVVAPPTVYRALGRLMEEGLIHRLESLNAFVACTHTHRNDAIGFAVCDECGTVEEFESQKLTGILHDWAENAQFALRQTIIELRGRCAACAAERE
jgi:Fur family transcriptional regulator, zinc uptake regulator